MTEQESPINDRVEGAVAAVLAAYGERLDEAGLAAVRQHAERLRQAAALLAGFPLGNWDEPDSSFQAIDRVDRA